MYTEQTVTESERYDFQLPSLRRPVVSLESFFTENEDENSIAPGLDKPRGVSFFYEQLLNIRDRADVQEVLVEITHIEVMETGSQFLFPISQRVYIITSASPAEVLQWVSPLMPDNTDEGGLHDDQSLTRPVISDGNRMFAIDWY